LQINSRRRGPREVFAHESRSSPRDRLLPGPSTHVNPKPSAAPRRRQVKYGLPNTGRSIVACRLPSRHPDRRPRCALRRRTASGPPGNIVHLAIDSWTGHRLRACSPWSRPVWFAIAWGGAGRCPRSPVVTARGAVPRLSIVPRWSPDGWSRSRRRPDRRRTAADRDAVTTSGNVWGVLPPARWSSSGRGGRRARSVACRAFHDAASRGRPTSEPVRESARTAPNRRTRCSSERVECVVREHQ
jgi:hypothetical protein